MSAMASQIPSPTMLLLFIQPFIQAQLKKKSKLAGWPVNSPHIGPVTQQKFPFDDVIMGYS